MTFATFVGLDLHKRYITACALAADGTLLGEVRRMPVTMDAPLGLSARWLGPERIRYRPGQHRLQWNGSQA